VIRLKAALLMFLWVVGLSANASAQQAQQSDAERLRVELSERARQEAEQRDWETKIFQIRYVDPDELRRVLSMFRSNISYSGGGLRALSVKAPKEIMPAIEDAIKRLDVPSPRRDAELTIFILVASDQMETGGAIPSSLQPVVNQLKPVLSYKSYQLVDTLIAHGSESRGQLTQLRGTVSMGPQSASYEFHALFRFQNSEGKTPTLRLEGMNFKFRTPLPAGNESVIAADVDIPQGQQVVVGKATMGDKAIILVMSARFSN
jgi:hypothetical protein